MNYTGKHIVPYCIRLPFTGLPIRNVVLSIISVFLFSFFGSISAQSISVTGVSPAAVCVGGTVTITYNVTNVPGKKFDNTSLYTIYFSNSLGNGFIQQGGSFTNTTQTYDITNNGTTVGLTKTFTIPFGTPAGSGYKISIGSTGPTFDGSTGAGASAAFTINALPNITGNLTTCVGGTTQLSADVGPAASNPWLSATPTVATISSGGLVTGVAAGTSTIQYTDINGCMRTTTVTVNSAATITLSSAAGTNVQTKCVGTALTPITYNIVGATGASITAGSLPAGVTGIYNAGVFTISGTPTASGTFNYTVTTTGPCTNASASGTITVKPLPTATIDQSGTYCQNSANLQLTITGQTAGANFTASPGGLSITSGGLINFGASSQGTYTITYSFNDGSGVGACTNTANATITVAAASGTTVINGNTALCTGGTSTLSSPNGGGTWTSSNTSVATINSSTGLVNAVAPGSTTITYTVNTGGCILTGTTTVTVTAPPTVSITGTATICSGTTTTLSPTSGGTWVSNNTSVATVNASGVVTGVAGGSTTFTFTSSTAPNCSATTGAVTVNTTPTITAQPISLADCKGNSVTFSASYSAVGNVSYQWQTSPDGITWTNIGAFPNVTGASGTSSSSPLQLNISNVGVGGGNGANTSGLRYRVTIIDASNCSVTTNGIATLIVNSISAISGSVTTTLCEGQSISFTATTAGNVPISYQWVKHIGAVWTDVPGATSTTLNFSNVTLADAGEYAIKATFPSTTNTGAASTCIEINYGITRTIVVNAAATVTAGGPDNICQSTPGTTITLSGASIGGGASTGTWSITSGGGTLSNTGPTANPGTVTYTPVAGFTGTVTLLLTTNDPDGAGGPCAAVNATRTINVLASPATPVVGANSPCVGGTLNLTSSVAGVTWTGPNGFTSSAQNPTITNVPFAASGTYTASITNANGCTRSASVVVSICTTISNNTITMVSSSCSVILQGTLPTGCTSFTYQWYSSFDNASAGSFSVIPGATGPDYTVPAGSKNNWYYRVAICSDNGTTSQSNTVHAHAPLAAITSQTNVKCFGASTGIASVDVSDGNPSYTYQWTNSSGNVIPGGSGTSNSNNGFTSTINNLPAGVYTFTVTDQDNPQPCTQVRTVTITEPPQLSVSIPTASYCFGSSNTLTATPSGGTGSYTYQWQNNGANIAGAVFNTYTASAPGTYSVIVTDGNNCTANSGGTVTVLATPTVTNTPLTQTVCSGGNTTLVTLTSNVAGATFAWTASASGGISGFAASGTNTIPVQTITNSGTTAGTVTYSITPTGPSPSNCPGTVAIYTITVNPSPVVTTPATANTCSGTSPNISLTANIASTFTWTIGTITGGITGASAGSGSTINQILTNPSTSVAGTVEYIVTPTSTSGSCPGVPYTITVTVNPKPVVTTANTATICSGASTNINLTASVASTFSWTIGTITGGVTGASAGSGSTINQTLTYGGITSGTVQYIVTPTASTSSCAGNTYTITVTVNPAPTVTTAATKIICSGASTNISLTANVASTFTWTIGAITGGITGATAGNGSTINQALTNPSTSVAGTVEYIVTPTSTAGSCPGVLYTITVTVNPSPVVTTPATANTCSGTSPNISLTANIASTFTWTIGTITGGITGASAGSGSTINQTLTNPSTSVAGTVEYIVTPTSATCAGAPYTITVTVNPKPVVTTANTATVCSGASTNINLTASVPSSFSWTIGTITGGVTGASAGSGSTINQALTYGGVTSGTVQYIVTPTASTGSCVGNTYTITVTVNPAPTVTTAATKTICSGASTNISLTANVASTFTWTIGTITGGITGASAGSGSTINQTLTNPGNAASGTVDYIVTPTATAGSCAGAAYTITVTVNPTPSAPTGTDGSRCGTGIVALGASGCAGGTLNWYAASSGGASLGTGINFTTPSIAATTTYYVSCTIAGCESARTPVTATVNTIPAAPTAIDGANCGTGTVILDATGCTGTLQWYSASTGGTLLGTGSPFTTPSISATTNYWVSCLTAAGCEGPRTQVVATIKPLDPGSIAANQNICSGGDPAAFTNIASASSTDNNVNGNITYKWYSGPSATGPWTVIGGATATTYDPPAGLAATTYYYREATGVKTNGPQAGQYTCVVNSNVITVNVNPLPTITGTPTVCIGATTQLTGTGNNPSWSSSNNSIATVSATGLVTGVAQGTATITYTDSNGCKQTATVTVNPKPAPVITHN